MLVEGYLNVSWGVWRPIRLKMQDEKQTLPPGPQSPVSLLDHKRFLVFIFILILILIFISISHNFMTSFTSERDVRD